MPLSKISVSPAIALKIFEYELEQIYALAKPQPQPPMVEVDAILLNRKFVSTVKSVPLKEIARIRLLSSL
jgi:hypothetical protein